MKEGKIWELANEDFDNNQSTPYEIMTKYRDLLNDEIPFIKGYLEEGTSELDDFYHTYFYLFVPDLNDYMFKIFDVIQLREHDYYPVIIKYFDGNQTNISKNLLYLDFEETLISYIKLESTKKILGALTHEVGIRKLYGKA
jgi:hypothetical protein